MSVEPVGKSIEGVLKVGTLTDYPISAASRSHCRVSVSFPGNSPQLSNAIQASANFDLGFEAAFNIDSSASGSFDYLIAEPLKVVLFSVSADARHQTPAFEFSIFLDALLTQQKTEISADLIGKHCEEGEFDASITAPSLHLSFSVNTPIIGPQESASSAILRLKAEEIAHIPKAIISSTLHPDDCVHPFDYIVAFKFPCGRVVQLPAGAYVFSDPPSVKWDSFVRIFLPSTSVKALLDPNAKVEFEVWRDINDDFSNFSIAETTSNCLNGHGSFPASDFAKPGQSHFASELPIFVAPGELTLKGLEQAQSSEEADTKRQKSGKKPPSRGQAKRKPKRPITAKDKKQLKVLNSQLAELTSADGFDGKSALVVDFQFSQALVMKPLVPRPTVKPSDIVKKAITTPAHHLEEATREYREAVQRLANEIICAQKLRQEYQLAMPDYPDDLVAILNKYPSYHTALEKLQLAVSYVFSEFALAHNPQTQQQMDNLFSNLPFYLHDELCKQLPGYFVQARQPGDHRKFLIRESKEAELMGRHSAASEFLEELIASDLTDSDSWWRYSKLMLLHGEFSRAEECVRRGLTYNPNHVKLSILFASLLSRQDKFIEAIDFLKAGHFEDELVKVVLNVLNSLANLPPESGFTPKDTSLSYARKLMRMMDVVFPEQLIAQEQMAKGETAEVLQSFGELHYYMRDYTKSTSFLTRSIGLEKTPESLFLLGHVEFERGRNEEAAHWFTEGLDMTFDAKAALRLGFVYLRMKEYQKAEAVLFQCSPQSASVLLGLSIAAINLEKYKQAEELLNQATAVNFRHPEVWAQLALLSMKLERKDEAEHAAQMAVKWHLKDDEMLRMLKENHLIGEGQ